MCASCCPATYPVSVHGNYPFRLSSSKPFPFLSPTIPSNSSLPCLQNPPCHVHSVSSMHIPQRGEARTPGQRSAEMHCAQGKAEMYGLGEKRLMLTQGDTDV